MLVVVVWLSSRIPNCTLKRSAGRILVETGWKTLFWLNCCERKTLFRLKKKAEQVEYEVSQTSRIWGKPNKSSDSGGSTGLRRCLFWAFCRTHVLHRTGHGAKTCASRVYSRLRWSEEEDERVLTVASAVALGRSGGAHIVGRGVVARRRQAVKGPMECERGHECSGECYRAGGLGTDGSIKRRMGIERTRGWMRGRSPWCRFRQVKDAERKWRYS